MRKKRGVVLEESEDKDEEARKKKKKKKKKKTQKAKPGEPESLEAMKRLAEQEFRDDDDTFFGESTTSSDDENEDSDTESDVDEKELKREKEKHDKLLSLHVKNLHKAEKKAVKESVKTKVLRLFRRGPLVSRESPMIIVYKQWHSQLCHHSPLQRCGSAAISHSKKPLLLGKNVK